MRRSEIQSERLLEINFVDVGQGDGSFIVTPNDDYLLVDAGLDDNMLRFLSWRFNLRFHRVAYRLPRRRHHPSRRGPLRRVREAPRLGQGSTSARRTTTGSSSVLGATAGPDDAGRRDHVPDRCRHVAALHTIIDDPARVGGMHYPNLMKTAVDDGHADDVAMLSAGGFVEGFTGRGPVARGPRSGGSAAATGSPRTATR